MRISDYKERARELVEQMTVAEKASLCSGEDCWNTKAIERLGIPSIMVSDGPHGLRKQLAAQDNFGIGESVKATCFPTASLIACSFDPTLTEKVGEAIGEECRKENVSVLLGPGVNMKRSTLCGRNFEYYSEDPLVAGKMAAGMIRGVQSTGVGTSLKHFAANNQERRRMSVNAVVDERTLREYYLKAFEIAVEEANPTTVMCSYNKLNGFYASENEWLLTKILRKEWGYEGVTISDWGAVHNRVAGVNAGLDLEMPGSAGVNDKKLIDAFATGRLSERALDASVTNVTALALMLQDGLEQTDCDMDKHHALAVEAATESMVLAKNRNNILPIGKERVLVVGRFASTPRYQGAGSSKINPIQIDSPYEQLQEMGVNCTYLDGDNIEEAVRDSRKFDKVIIFTGLSEQDESEGFDRRNMRLAKHQNELVKQVAAANNNTVVVLMGGAPMELPWENSVKAILIAYLGGEGTGRAIAELLTGRRNPCGRLAETWPYHASDAASHKNFPGDRLNVCYKESIYCGYRYFDTAQLPVRYMFGHGLSYTEFSYANPRTDKESYNFGDKIFLEFDVTNIGEYDGAEISLAYVKNSNDTVFMPLHTLVGFTKNKLTKGTTKTAQIVINTRELGYYNVETHKIYAPSGDYEIQIGGTLDAPALTIHIKLVSEEQKEPDYLRNAIGYFSLDTQGVGAGDTEFEYLLGKKLPYPAAAATRPFTMDNCLEDTQKYFIGRLILKIALKFMGKVSEAEKEQSQMMEAAIKEMPFFALYMSSNGMLSERQMEGIVDLINGRVFRGIWRLAIKKRG